MSDDVDVEALAEHFAPEDLDDDLESYIEESGLWPMLRHPLVYSVPYMPQLNRQINISYRYKQKALAQAEADEQWYTYVWLHERAYRVDAFMTVMDQMPDNEYWEILAHMWAGLREHPAERRGLDRVAQ